MSHSVTVTRSFSISREHAWTPWALSVPFFMGLIAVGVLPGGPIVHAIAVAIAVLCAAATWVAIRHHAPGWKRDAQLASAVLIPVVLAAQTTPFFLASILLFVAVVSISTDIKTSAIIALVTIVLFGSLSTLSWMTGVEIAFIAAFAVVGHAVAKAHSFFGRQKLHREIESQREHLVQQAAEFRLSATRTETQTGETARQDAKAHIHRHAVEAVNHSIYLSLSLLKTGLRCHTVVLLWFDLSNQKLRIKELVSDSDQIAEHDISPAKGLVGGISRRRESLKLNDIRDGFRGIPYYNKTPNLRSFIGVPVLENGRLRGVICADRISDESFEEEDVALVEESASYIMRTIENERMFASIEKSKYELGRFFDASRQFNTVLTTDEAIPVLFECAKEIAPYEYAAVTFFEEGVHKIGAVEVIPGLEDIRSEWIHKSFEDNQGLVAMAIRNRHYLPYGGMVRDRTVLFTSDQEVPPTESLLVIPLIAQDIVVGTLVLGHSKPNKFSTERREMIEVVANQFAVTFMNARMFEQMKEMATTDGLTGLANHRTFQARMDEAIARHRRNNQQLCLLLTDIDHFKSVNDTHGHPAGDEVLRQVAKCFEQSLRETDVPCRYGGEEFAIILENTDLDGAVIIANRIRESIKKLEFESDAGKFRCSMSIGVAGWPDDALDKQALVDLSDQALYAAKENGRDQVRAFRFLAQKAG